MEEDDDEAGHDEEVADDDEDDQAQTSDIELDDEQDEEAEEEEQKEDMRPAVHGRGSAAHPHSLRQPASQPHTAAKQQQPAPLGNARAVNGHANKRQAVNGAVKKQHSNGDKRGGRGAGQKR